MDNELKETMEKINRQHDYYDWDFGSGWGAAKSCPYCTRRYLSKEASEAIVAEAKSLLKAWEKKLKKIPASQRILDKWGYDLCPELDCGGEWKFNRVGNKECMLRTVTVPGTVSVWENNDRVEREIRMAIYFQPIYVDEVRGRRCIKVFSDNPASWHLEWNWTKPLGPDSGYPLLVQEDAGKREVKLFWDKELNKFYVLYKTWVETQPIDPSERRRNWARGRKHKEFMGKCKELQKKLAGAGIAIKRIVQDGYTHVPWAGCRNAYVECLWPGEIQPVPLAAAEQAV